MKRILFVSLVLFVVVIMVSSCFKLTVDSVTTDELKVVLSSGDLVISTRSAFSGIEISLVGEILQEDVLCGDGMICVVTSRQGRSYVAVVKPGQEFATGERVLTISGDYVSLKGLGITSQSASIPESHKPSATEPLNDGISVIDGIVFKESEGSFFIRGKNISNIGGSEIILNYDSSYFEIDTSKGNNGVTALNQYASKGIHIVQHNLGTLVISTAFGSSGVNIVEENMLRVHLLSKSIEGESAVTISAEVRNTSEAVIPTEVFSGVISFRDRLHYLHSCNIALDSFRKDLPSAVTGSPSSD